MDQIEFYICRMTANNIILPILTFKSYQIDGK